MTPYRAIHPFDWASILCLIRAEFAFMDARINPPSSMHRLTEADIAAHAESGQVWVIGGPPVACMFLTIQTDTLYLGKLAVSGSHRGTGLAKRLVSVAEERATELGLAAVELQTRVELLENQAAFRAMGFLETGRTTHPGFAQPTSITYRKAVQAR